MPPVTRVSGIAGQPAVAPTTGPTPVAPVSGPTFATSPTLSMPPAPSAAASAQYRPLIFNGIADAVAHDLKQLSQYNLPSAGQNSAVQTWGKVGAGALDPNRDRGYIETRCTAVAGGWQLEVDTHYFEPGETINHYLSLRITDVPEEHWVVVAVPHYGPMTPTGTDAVGMQITTDKLFVALDDLNAFLLKKAGTKADGTPKLQFQPGDPFTVDAVWESGHECGGRPRCPASPGPRPVPGRAIRACGDPCSSHTSGAGRSVSPAASMDRRRCRRDLASRMR